MSDPQRLIAVERALAATIEQFLQFPDALFGDSDLQGAFCRMLQSDPLFADRYVTRDGRHTGLVHQAYPAFRSHTPGVPTDVGHLDAVVLAPSFVRGYPLEIVTNETGRPVTDGQDREPRDRPLPLLAALTLRMEPALTPETLTALEEPWNALLRTEQQAQRLYMAICCTHWDLERQLLAALPLFEHWAARHTQVSLVVVQAHYDRIGRVVGGRYFNLWKHTALLPPLQAAGQASGTTPWTRH